MQNTDIQRQLDSLREEIRDLNASLVRLRPEDIRTVYGDQTRSVLMEWIERFFQQRAQKAGNGDEEARLQARLIEIVGLTDQAIRGHGRDHTLIALDQLETDFLPPSKGDHQLRRFVLNLVSQSRYYIEDSDVMVQEVGPATIRAAVPALSNDEALSPTTVEWVLGPLSNSLRIRILMLLSKGDERLVDLCESMNMQKGHIQYHLRTLMGNRYIIYDRKSRLYSITGRGRVALDGLAKLTDLILSA